jgi:hypothetical protein
MNEKRIEEIVRKVYVKAKKSCVSHKNNALANHVEDEIFKNHKKNISYRTIERAFDKYIDGKHVGSPIAESVDLFCKFLGYENYSDYISKTKRRNWVLTITLTIVLGAVLLIISISPMGDANNHIPPANECMAWADSLYIPVSCTENPYSTYGTDVEPLDSLKLKNFKKVEVNMATQFFTEETNKPLIWYYKNKDSEIEYYTAPGLHPINGETLRKITPYIIQTYVPQHIDRKGSFVQ